MLKPALLACCLLPLWAQAKVEDLDRVVAVVDEDVVMASELNQQLERVKQQIAARGDLPPEEELKEQVLEHLIIQRIQMSLADRLGMEINDSEVDQTLNRLRTSKNLSPEEFVQQLQADGLSVSALRQQLRNDLLVQRVQQARVYYRIQISDQEVDNFLNSEEGKFWLSPEFNLGHILVPFSNNGRGEDLTNTQVQARALFERLQRGENFRSLAVSNSGGQNALEGGDLGWRKAVELPEVFSERLNDMQPGQISEPFKSGAGFHILKVYDRRGAEETVIEQSKVRHVLLKPSAILSDEQAVEQLKTIRERALSGEVEFAELAREHSEDIGSMLSGGDLGWSVPGKFVPEFEEMMKTTAVGEVSQPFRSQFGWHILYIEDRRQENMTDTVIRNQAVNLLRSRRFNEELEIWLQEIRAQAYVENRLQ